jgi:hypothetical protein
MSELGATLRAPSTRGELRRWRRMSLAAWALGGVGLVASFVWGIALSVDIAPTLPVPRDGDATAAARSAGGTRSALATAGFERRLSPAPPPPPSSKEEAKDTSRFGSLELVAISREDGELVAAIFDPVKQTLHLVRNGGSIDGTIITAVDAREVRLSEGKKVRTLRLVTAKEREAGKQGGA